MTTNSLEQSMTNINNALGDSLDNVDPKNLDYAKDLIKNLDNITVCMAEAKT